MEISSRMLLNKNLFLILKGEIDRFEIECKSIGEADYFRTVATTFLKENNLYWNYDARRSKTKMIVEKVM